MPYRDDPVEYPPLSLPLFLVPRSVAPGLGVFKVAFAAEMLVFNAAAVLLVARWAERRQGLARVPSRLAWYTLYFVILFRLVVCRYDAAPMLLGFGASLLWSSGRTGMGGLAAAFGSLMKFYPAVVPVLASVRNFRRPNEARGKGASVFALSSLLGATAWVLLCVVRGVAASLRYHLGRGFEFGSVYSGARMLAAKLAGAEIVTSRDHASFSSVTPWSAPLLA